MKQLLFILLLLPVFAKGQNIVPNPTFYTYWSCPPSQSQINLCKYWYNVTSVTPDYWNACNTNPYTSCPSNFAGYQSAPDSAMTGVFTYAPRANAREYFGTDIPALTIGETYQVTVKVSLADSVEYASDGLGVFFYVDAKPDTTLDTLIVVTPQIDYTSYGVISDKVNWTILTASFVADSAYTHLVIGNFKSDTNISLVHTPTYWSAYANASYYYFDSVSVEKVIAIKPTDTITVIISPGTIDSVTGTIDSIKTTQTTILEQDLEELYPNPVTDELVINTSRRAYQSFTITNSIRQVMMQKSITSSTTAVNTKSLPKGVYMIVLKGEEGVSVQRFLKE
jgi:hypothetical protein